MSWINSALNSAIAVVGVGLVLHAGATAQTAPTRRQSWDPSPDRDHDTVVAGVEVTDIMYDDLGRADVSPCQLCEQRRPYMAELDRGGPRLKKWCVWNEDVPADDTSNGATGCGHVICSDCLNESKRVANANTRRVGTALAEGNDNVFSIWDIDGDRIQPCQVNHCGQEFVSVKCYEGRTQPSDEGLWNVNDSFQEVEHTYMPLHNDQVWLPGLPPRGEPTPTNQVLRALRLKKGRMARLRAVGVDLAHDADPPEVNTQADVIAWRWDENVMINQRIRQLFRSQGEEYVIPRDLPGGGISHDEWRQLRGYESSDEPDPEGLDEPEPDSVFGYPEETEAAFMQRLGLAYGTPPQSSESEAEEAPQAHVVPPKGLPPGPTLGLSCGNAWRDLRYDASRRAYLDAKCPICLTEPLLDWCCWNADAPEAVTMTETGRTVAPGCGHIMCRGCFEQLRNSPSSERCPACRQNFVSVKCFEGQEVAQMSAQQHLEYIERRRRRLARATRPKRPKTDAVRERQRRAHRGRMNTLARRARRTIEKEERRERRASQRARTAPAAQVEDMRL